MIKIFIEYRFLYAQSLSNNVVSEKIMNSLKITYLDKILHEMNGSINNIYFLSNFMLNKAKLDKGEDKEGLRNRPLA